MFSFSFFANSILLGFGLAMDAFSVSMADGLADPSMPPARRIRIAGMFALFQFLMPMIGWILVHTLVTYFQAFSKAIPWIALGLLGWIGGKMLAEGIGRKASAREKQEADAASEKESGSTLSWGVLILQAVATSIDALSVGFTISTYILPQAFICALLIAVVTYLVCEAGVRIGAKFGTRLADKASVLGGVILILIGLEIFIRGVFFS